MIAFGLGFYLVLVLIGVLIWLGKYRELLVDQQYARAARDGRDRAYIVGTLDIRGKKPRMVAVRIYSCRADGLTALIQSEFHFDIDCVSGGSFHEAKENAERYLRDRPYFAWALELYERPWPEQILEPIEDYRKDAG
jgi:hypothetical protein